MKRIPIEKRKVSTTIALSPTALSRLELICGAMDMSRSAIAEDAIELYYRFYLQYCPDRADWMDEDPLPPEIPDDVRAKDHLSSIYGEVHENAE